MKDFQLTNWLKILFELSEIKIEYNRPKNCCDSFFSIPDIKNAKFILPLQNSLKAYWRGLDLYPAMLPGLLFKKGLMAIGGLVAPAMKSQRLFLCSNGVEKPAQKLYELLAANRESIDKVKSFAVRTGSAGIGFKLVFQFQGKRGNVISYIKVGDPVYRGTFLLNEKRILEYLKTHRDVVVAPDIIGYKEHGTFSALEISAIKKIRYFPRPNHENVGVLLGNLCKNTARAGKEGVGAEKGTEELVDLYLENERTRGFVRNSIDYLSSKPFPRPLCHRDLAGWNLFFCENGKLGILDWEFARLNRLPFQDLFHYFLHTKIHNSRLSPVEAYKKVFERDRQVRKAIDIYAEIVGIKDTELQRHLMVGYLWDWYSLERSRAGEGDMQGKEYLEILDWLAENGRFTTERTENTEKRVDLCRRILHHRDQ